VPVTEIHQLAQVTCPATFAGNTWCSLEPIIVPEYKCPYATISQTEQRDLTKEEQKAARKDARCEGIQYFGSGAGNGIVDDGVALATYTGAGGDDLAVAEAMLRSGGVVVRDPRYIKDGKATFAVLRVDNKSGQDPAANATRITFDAYLLTTGVAAISPILSPGAVATAGLATTPSLMIAATTRMPTQVESDKMYAQLQNLGVGGNIEQGPQYETDERLWILMGAAALITLGAAGIGTGLAAADSRPDLSTLASVGASPRMRRGLSLSQSGVIAGLGSLLGAGAGLGAALAVIVALNQQYAEMWPGPAPLPVAIPWPSLSVALLVVPAIAMLGAGLLTRSRLPIERRL
jgi:putative ABC transport system permease protein